VAAEAAVAAEAVAQQAQITTVRRFSGCRIVPFANLPGTRDHTRVHAAYPHREFPGGSGRRLARRAADEAPVQLRDRRIQLAATERGREEHALLVAEVLRGQFPSAAGLVDEG